MRHLSLISFVAAVLFTFTANVALAKDPLPGLKPDKNTGMTTSVRSGEVVEFRLAVDVQGSFTAPQGWTSRFSQTKKGGGPITCAPDRPATCGVWIATASVSASGNFTFGYTPPSGAATNTVITVNVEAPPPPPPNPQPTGSWYPADKGDKLEKRVDTIDKRTKETVSLFMEYKFSWNVPTTTDVGHGFQLGVSALVVDQGPAARLSVGGKFGWSRTKIEIAPELNPKVTEAPEDRYTGAFTIAWTPCLQIEDAGVKRDFWCFGLGAMTGLDVYSYDTTFISARKSNGVVTEVENVRDRTQFGWVIGPEGNTSIRITPNFGLRLGLALPITVTNISRVVGEEESPGVPKSGRPAVNAEFHGGALFSF